MILTKSRLRECKRSDLERLARFLGITKPGPPTPDWMLIHEILKRARRR